MSARLGNALYVAACILALLLLLDAAWSPLFTHDRQAGENVLEAIFAFFVWLPGRGCRYVLTGR